MIDALSTSSELYRQARELMAENRIEDASSLFQQSIALSPHFKALELLGECFVDAVSETWVHSGGKVGGVIVTLACEPVPGAGITFADKKRRQLVTPDRAGRFVVELPAGKYRVSASIPGRGLVKAGGLVLAPAKNGTLRLYVDTGVEVAHGCFGPDVEDLLIPAERGVVSDRLMERPPASKP